MQITRVKHMSHLVRLMPLLILAIVAQGYLYTQWRPVEMALDVSIFMAIGVAFMAAGFGLYDQFHQVYLYRKHMLVKFDLIGYCEEILYQEIQDIEVEVTRYGYYNVTLYLTDGSTCKLPYLDDVQELKAMLN